MIYLKFESDVKAQSIQKFLLDALRKRHFLTEIQVAFSEELFLLAGRRDENQRLKLLGIVNLVSL